jgi:sigma-B regulation protein RsbU (phosphoserine phosphatase)
MLLSNSKKVLIVDDQRFILELISRSLKKGGFQCIMASSAYEAMEVLDKEIPDIILSDYQMPGLNGFEFRQKLMEDSRWSNIPFIFLTSHTDQELILKGLDLQVLDYIAKDTPIPILVSKVNNILHAIEEENKKSIQELRKAAEALNLRSVPISAPVIKGFNVDFWHRSYQDHPGGDFIDFIRINDDYTFIILGDVMGKKWGAWVFSFSFLSYIRSAVRLCVFENNLSTASILNKINHVICLDQVLSDVLSSLSLLLIEHKTGKVCYSGAGDLPVIHYDQEEKEVKLINSAGLLLGLFPDGGYTEESVVLKPGDKLIVLTDGMIDFQDETGKKSDYNLFVNLITPVLENSATLELIKDSTVLKEKNKEQIDDCSIIFIEKTTEI